jgi:hypothetical protein
MWRLYHATKDGRLFNYPVHLSSGGTETTFEEAWPSMWEEMLKRRTIDADGRARQHMARSGVSRI